MSGILYGVGVGPGDKELLTLKALNVLKASDVIMVPVTGQGDSAAYDIVRDYVDGEKVKTVDMPMTRDVELLQKNYEKIAGRAENFLKEGKQVAVITLGDPTVYSTYMQINSIVKEHGFETVIIPGITSFCAAAARLNIPLCERDERLLIIPSGYDISRDMEVKGAKVLMKAGKSLPDVVKEIKKAGLKDKTLMIERCGMDGEKIYTDIDAIGDKASYFSLFIVKS